MRPLVSRTFKAGTVIFHEGDGPGAAYLVKTGTARVTVSGAPEAHELAIVGGNSIFGEMSLVDGSPRSATVTVIEDMECYVIDKSRFNELFEGAHPIAKTLFEIQCQRLRKLTQTLSSTQS
ncbi:MAG: cyclic nucleotide-binding domain-containing protein [Rickettsiales bacterium]|nr:cyclic nucleotide-binding domain-containing protein [Rickettsiales bacterium]